MSDDLIYDDPSRDSGWLPYLENWYRQTNNPLYAWEAIARCLGSGMSIPDWAADYLKLAAGNIATLGLGFDFREPEAVRIEAAQAMRLIGQALDLSTERHKNAFARRKDDGRAVRAAISDEYRGRATAREELVGGRRSADRADRIIRRGYKLKKQS